MGDVGYASSGIGTPLRHAGSGGLWIVIVQHCRTRGAQPQARAANPVLDPRRRPAPSPGQVAILLPLSGRLGDIGRPMLRAAQLYLAYPGSPTLIVKDTAGSPDSAARAAEDAIAEGAK